MFSFKERAIKFIFSCLAFSCLLFLLAIVVILFWQGAPLFSYMDFSQFFFGKSWYPTSQPPEFGIFPLISGSLIVTLGAMVVCVPLGIGSALYIYELSGPNSKKILKPIVEILGSIPSIVFGFFALTIAAPAIQQFFNIPTGLCALTASIILGIMAIPTITSISEDALSFVPNSFREASYALGANKFQTLFKVTIPAAASGISTSVILGMSRIVGETMTVLMVSGGAAVITSSFFSPVRPMTATIAAEMGEAAFGSLHYQALFAIALVLFMTTLVFNVIAERISQKYALKLGANR
ncbi:MAG: phosphate ABC transporter permease subunit PstC [Elusimicrobiota bacterium]|jgi:phosphate transport system permease protein|nr:phosphate ABC transporter permease subunit PstC [Elusimicrobiota bacterium]